MLVAALPAILFWLLWEGYVAVAELFDEEEEEYTLLFDKDRRSVKVDTIPDTRRDT